jgi:cytochrome c2
MKAKADSTFPTYSALKGALKRTPWRQFYCILASLNCVLVLTAFSMTQRAHSASLSQASQPVAQDQTFKAPKSHEEVDLSSKSPDELAAYVFEHHHCDTCHTLGKGEKLGFTDRGKEVGKNFEGCISLLTSMNVITQIKPANRTTEEKAKAARFQQFGCTACHQITPGKLGLTEYGTKLKSLHMACTDVERILAK